MNRSFQAERGRDSIPGAGTTHAEAQVCEELECLGSREQFSKGRASAVGPVAWKGEGSEGPWHARAGYGESLVRRSEERGCPGRTPRHSVESTNKGQQHRGVGPGPCAVVQGK